MEIFTVKIPIWSLEYRVQRLYAEVYQFPGRLMWKIGEFQNKVKDPQVAQILDSILDAVLGPQSPP